MLTGAYKQTPSKSVSKLYSGLQKQSGRNSLYVKQKWELEIDIYSQKVSGIPCVEHSKHPSVPKDGRNFAGIISDTSLKNLTIL